MSRWPSLPMVAVLLGTFVSLLGDSVTTFTLILQGSDGAGPDGEGSWRVTEIMLADLIPPILLAPVLAALADRFDAKRLWVMALLSQAAVFGLAATQTNFHLWVTFTATGHVIGVISGAAAFRLVPHIAGTWGTERANSALVSLSSVAFLIGPPTAGLLRDVVGMQWVLLANAATFVVIAVVAWCAVADQVGERASLGSSKFRGAWSGLQALMGAPVVVALLPVLAGIILVTSVEGVAGVFYLRELTGSDREFGLLIACWAVGSIVGSTVAGWKWFSGRIVLLTLGGAALISVALLVAGAVPVVWLIGAVFVVGGFGNGAHVVGVRNMVYEHVPSEAHGRAWTFYGVMSATCVALGNVLGTPVGVLSPQALVVVAGAAGCGVVAVGVVLVRRALARLAAAPQSVAADA